MTYLHVSEQILLIISHCAIITYEKAQNIAKNKKMMSQCHRYVLTSLVVRNKNPPVVPHKWPVMQICLVFFCWPEQTVEQAVELLVIWYIYIHIYHIYIYYWPQVWNILKPNGNIRTWHFDLLEMAWHQPQPGIVTLIHFSCIVLGMKNTICNVRNQSYTR